MDVSNLIIEAKTTWEENFFRHFHPDEFELLQTMLQKNFPFSMNNDWSAISITDSRHEKLLARVLVTMPKTTSFFFFGYFYAIDEEVAKKILNLAFAAGVALQKKEMRGPVEGNVFNSSRIRLDFNLEESFPADPSYPPHYNRYFEAAGLVATHFWSHLKVPTLLSFVQYVSLRWKFGHQWKNFCVETRDLNDERNLKIMYELNCDSYSSLSDYTPFSFEEFQLWTKRSLPLLKKEQCWFVLDEAKNPVAFNICLSTPDGKKIYDMYIGKKKNLEQKVKGLSALFIPKFFQAWPGLLLKKFYFCNVSDDSPTYKLLRFFRAKQVGRLALYSKKI